MPYDRLRFERILIYKLKREYGHKIDIYKVNTSVVDLGTGQKTVNKTVYPVYLAIPLTYDLARKYQYDHSYIAADKQFTQGAFYDPKIRIVMVDKADLPLGLELTLDDYLVIDGEKYLLQKISETIGRHALILTAKATTGQQPGQVFNLNVYHNLRFVQKAGV